MTTSVFHDILSNQMVLGSTTNPNFFAFWRDMGMQIKELLLGIPVLIFVFWVFSAPMPSERIVRVCEPIHWVGNLATSSAALSSEKHTETTVRWSDKMNYSCQYMVWRLIYQDDYNRAVKDGLIPPPAGTQPQAAPAQDPAASAAPAPAQAPAQQPAQGTSK